MIKYKIQPDYYEKFQCTADQCSDSCCVGWEIDIDKETLDYYSKVQGEFGQRLREFIVWEKDEAALEGQAHFLLQGERCPFLNQKNLCDIYTELGKEHLCQICSDHPRFFEWFPDRIEAGLGLCCEAAARLILDRETPISFVKLQEKSEASENEEEASQEVFKAMHQARETAFLLLQNRQLPMADRLAVFLLMTEELQDGLDFSDEKAIEETAVYYRENMQEIAENWLQEAQAEEGWQIQWFSQQISFMETLEPMDARWPGYLSQLKSRLPEIIKEREAFRCFYRKRDHEWEQLVVYFVYRYFLKSVFDGDVVSKAGTTVFSLLFIELMAVDIWLKKGDFTIEDQIENSKNYSKEIEYCTENMEALAERFWQEEAMNRGCLMAAMRQAAPLKEKREKGTYGGKQ